MASTWCRRCSSLLGLEVPADVEGISHADALFASDAAEPVRDHVYTTKTYHDSFDPIRAIRTKDYSYIENYVPRPLLDLPWDIEQSPSGLAVAPFVTAPRPERELYDLRTDPTETTNLLVGNAAEAADAGTRTPSRRILLFDCMIGASAPAT